jgi:hypothetical protein
MLTGVLSVLLSAHSELHFFDEGILTGPTAKQDSVKTKLRETLVCVSETGEASDNPINKY